VPQNPEILGSSPLPPVAIDEESENSWSGHVTFTAYRLGGNGAAHGRRARVDGQGVVDQRGAIRSAPSSRIVSPLR
jgi:hypothetical protein